MSQSESKSAAEGHKSGGEEGKSRYRGTLNLPQTSFPMKANLVQNEGESLKRWSGLYAKVRAARAGKPKFVFHDGPPYANGSIHLGHLMNKCLKDFVVRSRTMKDMDCPYVPGWDCHGLPIEHKVMTDMVEKGKVAKLNTLDEWTRKTVIRRECQAYAQKFHALHTDQMRRLLTLADYEHPYLTMQPSYEGATMEVLADLLDRGLVYRALKPVHWSVANETALADAELEYYDREDLSVYVDFEAEDAQKVYDAFGLPAAGEDDDDESGDSPARRGIRPGMRPSFMIWTTTPWTLPANVAIAVNADLEYALVFIDGNVTVMAAAAVERVAQKARSEEVMVLARTPGSKLAGLRYRHPFVSPARGEGVAAMSTGSTLEVPAHAKLFEIVCADYVTLEDGTGLVHTAPGHGVEDYSTGQREHLPIYCPVKGDGTYDQTVPEWLRGKDIFKANAEIVTRLRESGHLFHDHTFSHSYPHDWRSKTPVIFRCTEQWFVSVDRAFTTSRGEEARTLRTRAMACIDANSSGSDERVRFVPEWGRNRMRGMLESRPDWCISRQRAWGLPIPAFLLPDGRVHMTAASVRAVARVFREKGSDAWFTLAPEALLASYDVANDPEAQGVTREMLAQSRKGGDILDVWFESGSSWNAVMRERGIGYPIDLYLEGSDQHRGWFQLSMLPALGVTGRPPFRTLLTHGFMVAKDGTKLSKSKGDTVEGLFADYGVDVLRWWVASLSYENDIKVDREFFDLAGESYRKIRNTLRFLLSNLYDYDPAQGPVHADGSIDQRAFAANTPEAWLLSRLDALTREVVEAFEAYDFRGASTAIYAFCSTTLSAQYLAMAKDRLYCDSASSARRRRSQGAMYAVADGLCRLLAPILCHTADEAFRALRRAEKDAATCVHLELFPKPTGIHADPRWVEVMEIRERALAALEHGKKALGVENPLDAGLEIPDPDHVLTHFDPVDLADFMGVSEVKVVSGPKLGEIRVIDLRERPRCDRSWRRDATVKPRSDGGVLSDRDAAAVGVA